jgi:quercetin dioxygenase-like cupin family protein
MQIAGERREDNMTFVDLNNLKEYEFAKGVRARIINCDSMSISYVNLDAGAAMPEHNHINEQVVNVIEGELELTVNGEPRVLKPGVVEVLPPDVPHGAKALTKCRVIDVFHPAREDWVAMMKSKEQ